MRTLLFIALSTAYWFIVCAIGWTWILGAHPDMWKMLVVGLLNSVVSLLQISIMHYVNKLEDKPAVEDAP